MNAAHPCDAYSTLEIRSRYTRDVLACVLQHPKGGWCKHDSKSLPPQAAVWTSVVASSDIRGAQRKLSERGGRFTKNNAQRDAHYSQKQNVIVTVVDTPRSKARTAPILQHNERMRHLLSKRNLSIARTRQISGDDPMES